MSILIINYRARKYHFLFNNKIECYINSFKLSKLVGFQYFKLYQIYFCIGNFKDGKLEPVY
jgi:hypothetical protein